MAEGTDRRGTLIAALGNSLMGDDGAGAAVLEELRRRGVDSRARLREVGAAGVDLLLELEAVDTLILLDAVASEDSPGTVRVFREAALLEYAEQRGGGSHQPSLAGTLCLGEALGLLPQRVFLVAIAARKFQLGQELSAEVAAAVPRAADAAERLLDETAGAA